MLNLSIVREHLWRTIFPKRTSYSTVENVTGLTPVRRDIVLSECPISYCLEYRDTAVRALITEAKFHHNQHAMRLLATAFMSTWPANTLADSILIAIPLSAKRKRERGYNQITAILKHTPLKITEGILTRQHRTPQTRLSRTKRLTNQANSFQVSTKSKACITGAHLVLIDDVATTGTTLAAARAALAPHSPASITCIALAH